jgi:hypothetical protein
MRIDGASQALSRWLPSLTANDTREQTRAIMRSIAKRTEEGEIDKPD